MPRSLSPYATFTLIWYHVHYNVMHFRVILRSLSLYTTFTITLCHVPSHCMTHSLSRYATFTVTVNVRYITQLFSGMTNALYTLPLGRRVQPNISTVSMKHLQFCYSTLKWFGSGSVWNHRIFNAFAFSGTRSKYRVVAHTVYRRWLIRMT